MGKGKSSKTINLFKFRTGFKSIGNQLFQAFLIIFSVLFALFINKYTEQHQVRKQKELALESINKELANNQKVVTGWYEKHKLVKERIDSLLVLPEAVLKEALFDQTSGDFDIAFIVGKTTFVDDIMTSIAWESAQTIGIVSEFEYEQIQTLTQIYELQRFLINNTLHNFLEVMQDRNTYDPDHVVTTLLLFRWIIQEMVGQEVLLVQVYGLLLED